MGGCALDIFDSGQGPVAGSYEGNNNSGSVKCWDILEHLVASREGIGSLELIQFIK
jgi:hypothetical protein